MDIFGEIEPNQKERIIRPLRRAGHVVGYMGDGTNDAPALHAADVSISAEKATDVAKEAANIVLLERELVVHEGGVREGRRTFANTLKCVFMATSANFGNMFCDACWGLRGATSGWCCPRAPAAGAFRRGGETAIKSVRPIVIELYARVRVLELMAKAGGKLAERHCVS